MEIQFTWRPQKAKSNLQKHGFYDPHVAIIEDCEVDGEQRYRAIGFADGDLLLLVVYIDQSDKEKESLHIISARKTDAYEQSTYADQFA